MSTGCIETVGDDDEGGVEVVKNRLDYDTPRCEVVRILHHITRERNIHGKTLNSRTACCYEILTYINLMFIV